MRTVQIIPVALLALLLAFTGCDDTGTGPEDTIVLGTGADPIEVEFDFDDFSESDINNGTLTLTSSKPDDLGSQIRTLAGASRSNVVSAQVDSIRLERIGLRDVRPKIFGYLGSARVYYGEDTSTQLVAESSPIPANSTVTLSLVNSNITTIVQNQARPLTLELQLNEPSQIEAGQSAKINVWYRIEVTS